MHTGELLAHRRWHCSSSSCTGFSVQWRWYQACFNSEQTLMPASASPVSPSQTILFPAVPGVLTTTCGTKLLLKDEVAFVD